MTNRKLKLKEKRHERNRHRVRRKIQGSDAKPRICVFKSSLHTYAQVISDVSAKTYVCASTLDQTVAAKLSSLEAAEGASKSTKSVAAARAVGMIIAEKLKSAGINQAVFDRNGFQYHGRIKAIADGIREGGFKI